MRLAYATTYDSHDRTRWSGLGWHIGAALGEAGLEVCRIGPLRESRQWVSRWKGRLYYRLLKQTYESGREASIVRHYAAQVDSEADRLDANLVFSPGVTPVAHCRGPRPMAFWSDATFAGLVRLYPEHRRLCQETLRAGYTLDQLAFDRCHFAIFASDWAAQSALEYYRVDAAKVHIVPFGANLSNPPGHAATEAMIAARLTTAGRCELLFLGVDWLRKGGPQAVAVTRRLRQQGLEATLHIVGCRPELALADQSFVQQHGFLNKNKPAEDAAIQKLLAATHFLILPSHAECFGVVFAEASAFGIPSLATDVGGIPSAVVNGINGQLFPVDAAPESYADFVLACLAAPAQYRALAHAAHIHYEAQLNWQVAGRRVRTLLESCL